MKFPPLYAAIICTALMAVPPHLSGQPTTPAATNASGPRLTFATNEFRFGKVSAGTLVKYVFIATNTGDQTLVISNVAPGCHCTTAGDWTHHIEPGQTGKIPIQFDSGVFHGDVTKTILVTSNDKLAPQQTLSLRGTIWKMIDVSPQFAYITVMPDADSNATSVVHISNNADDPVILSEPTSANGSFKAELKTVKPGKEFTLTVTAVPPFVPGNTSGTISVKTSFTNMPVINVTTIAMMQPAVGVTPLQLVLPPQINGWLTNRVSITANVKKPLVLSDPAASDKRIIVQLTTLKPGYIFQIVAAFPPGFKVTQGQQEQISVKSDNATSPVIVVPIRQYPYQSVVPPPPLRPKVMSQNPPSPQPTAHP